jgi:hypothetical protein
MVVTLPRLFFHVDDGTVTTDEEGLEFSDLAAARREALRACGEMLREEPAVIWSGKPWRLWVTETSDASGKIIFSLSV